MRQNEFENLPLSVSEFDTLTMLLSNLLATKTTPVIIPGEAILGIEAIAAGVSAPGRTILNIVTGPYGSLFGKWLVRGGAEVIEVKTLFNEVATTNEIAVAIEKYQPSAISFVQAEAITGGSNPTKEILKLAGNSNLITIIDSVSAIGAEPVLMDDWNIDFVAIGAQKALSGPNGISAIGISERGWNFLESNPTAPRNSILSLLDLKPSIQNGNVGKVAANIPILEARAFIESLRVIEQVGLDKLNHRHSLSSRSTIAGIKELGLEPWQKDSNSYSPLNTTIRLPKDKALHLEKPVGILAPGDGDLHHQLLRINHYGPYANQQSVETAITVLAKLLSINPDKSLTAIRKIWNS